MQTSIQTWKHGQGIDLLAREYRRRPRKAEGRTMQEQLSNARMSRWT